MAIDRVLQRIDRELKAVATRNLTPQYHGLRLSRRESEAIERAKGLADRRSIELRTGKLVTIRLQATFFLSTLSGR